MSKVKRYKKRIVELEKSIEKAGTLLKRWNDKDPLIKSIIKSDVEAEQLAYRLIYDKGYVACLKDVIKEF